MNQNSTDTEFHSDVFFLSFSGTEKRWNDNDLKKWWWQFLTIKWLVKSLHLEQLGMFNSPFPKSREIGEVRVVRRKIAIFGKWTLNRKQMMIWNKLFFCVKLWDLWVSMYSFKVIDLFRWTFPNDADWMLRIILWPLEKEAKHWGF